MSESENRLENLALQKKFFTSDSRAAASDSIFVALKGEKSDGHSYVMSILSKNDVTVVVSEDFLQNQPQLKNHKNIFAVENTHQAHRSLAAAFRKKFKGKVIGVGGSSGKTSTKDFLAHLLQAEFKVLKTEKSQNGELGIPKTLEGLRDDIEVAVIEIGIDAPGDMIRHVELVQPDYALLTSIGEEHLNQLKSIEGVFREEKILFEKTWEYGGLCFAPKADPWLAKLSHPKLRFTPSHPHDLSPEFKTSLTHPYLLQNAALALAIGLELGVKKQALSERLQSLAIPEGRGDVLWESTELALVSDYYNSNPSSVRAGIENVLKIAKEHSLKPLFILGDMLDLGDESAVHHQNLLEELSKNSYELFLVGPEMKKAAALVPRLCVVQSFENSDEAAQYFKSHKIEKGIVLVKGSRGITLEKVFHVLKN